MGRWRSSGAPLPPPRERLGAREPWASKCSRWSRPLPTPPTCTGVRSPGWSGPNSREGLWGFWLTGDTGNPFSQQKSNFRVKRGSRSHRSDPRSQNRLASSLYHGFPHLPPSTLGLWFDLSRPPIPFLRKKYLCSSGLSPTVLKLVSFRTPFTLKNYQGVQGVFVYMSYNLSNIYCIRN